MIPLPMMLGGVGSVGGGGFTLDYDVNTVTDFPEIGQLYAIDLDPINNRLFLVAPDNTGGVFLSHLKVYDINPDGTLTEVFTETITLLPGEIEFTTFREYGTIYYPGSGTKVYVVRWTGMSTYDYDEATGQLTHSSNYDDLTNYPGGQYVLLNGMVMKPGGSPYFVSSAGRGSFLQAIALPVGGDQDPPINTSRCTYYNSVAKLTETIFYVASRDGDTLTINSLGTDGTITFLDGVATNMATSGSDNGNMVHCSIFEGFVYAQQCDTAQDPPLQPTRRWPIADETTGALGLHEDGVWDFRGFLPYLLELSNPGQRSAFTHNGHTYFIRQSDGNLDQLVHT